MKPIIKHESNEAYHANEDFVGSSTIKLYKRSPLHKRQGIEQTDAMIFGGAYHCMVLEPQIFFTLYFVFDDREMMNELSKDFQKPRASKPYKEYKEDQFLLAGSRQVIPIDQFLTMQEMYKALMSYKYIYWLFTRGENELSHYTELDGVKVKIKPDALHRRQRIIADLKTTQNASFDVFYHEAAKRAYHISGALYCDVAEQIYTDSVRPFRFILVAQEKDPPYAPAIYEVTYNFIAIGRYEYVLCLQQHKYCEETGIYEGYEVFSKSENGIQELGFPPYKNREYYFSNQFADKRYLMQQFSNKIA